jgi:hypothetical protein
MCLLIFRHISSAATFGGSGGVYFQPGAHTLWGAFARLLLCFSVVDGSIAVRLWKVNCDASPRVKQKQPDMAA